MSVPAIFASFCSLSFTSGVTWNLTSAERFSAMALGGLPPLFLPVVIPVRFSI